MLPGGKSQLMGLQACPVNPELTLLQTALHPCMGSSVQLSSLEQKGNQPLLGQTLNPVEKATTASP